MIKPLPVPNGLFNAEIWRMMPQVRFFYHRRTVIGTVHHEVRRGRVYLCSYGPRRGKYVHIVDEQFKCHVRRMSEVSYQGQSFQYRRKKNGKERS